MNYHAVIDIKNPDQLKILATEFQDLKKERFSVLIKDNQLIIDAKDAVALKAIVNSVINALTIFEKVEKLK